MFPKSVNYITVNVTFFQTFSQAQTQEVVKTGKLKRSFLSFLHLLFLLLSVGLGVVMVWMTLLLSGVNTCRVNFNCLPGLTTTTTSPSAALMATSEESSCPVVEPCTTIPGGVFYGGWVTVAFKYLDVVKFFFVFFMTFKS